MSKTDCAHNCISPVEKYLNGMVVGMVHQICVIYKENAMFALEDMWLWWCKNWDLMNILHEVAWSLILLFLDCPAALDLVLLNKMLWTQGFVGISNSRWHKVLKRSLRCLLRAVRGPPNWWLHNCRLNRKLQAVYTCYTSLQAKRRQPTVQKYSHHRFSELLVKSERSFTQPARDKSVELVGSLFP